MNNEITSYIHWIPEHENIKDNEIADKAAKSDTKQSNSSNTERFTFISYVKHKIKVRALKNWITHWKKTTQELIMTISSFICTDYQTITLESVMKTVTKIKFQSIYWQSVNISNQNNLNWKINSEKSIYYIQQRCCLSSRKKLELLYCFWRKLKWLSENDC